ncbi:MAG: glycosyltransferase family 39 protein, partial [Gemmatimonadetes bacterium]|nr:glycosyltransferase family 39 protein [Gemmatimonadota bacterium]
MRRFYGWFGIAALAVLVRALFLAEFSETVAFRSPVVDAYTYDQQARSVAAGGPSALELPYYQPPLYSMVLGALYSVAPGPWGPRVLQAALGVLTAVLVGLVAARIGGRRAGYVAGALFALYGPALWMEGELLPPTLVLTTTTTAIWLLGRADRAERPLRALVGAGVLLGVASAARPTSILFGILAGVWWALGGGRGSRAETTRPRRRLRSAIAFGLAIALPILPFTIANRVGGGENVVVSYNGGINFYLGNGANSDSLTAIQPGHHWDRLQIAPWAAGVRSRVGESNYWFERGLREAAADPGAWVAALGRKFVRLLDARETPRNTDFEVARRESRVLAAPLASFALVAPLALLGLWLGFADPSSRRLRSLLVLLLVAVAIENLAFFVAARYRLEAVPSLCILAGVGADSVLRSRGRPILALLVAAGFAGFVLVDWLGERSVDEARAAINRSVALQRAGFEASAARALEDA